MCLWYISVSCETPASRTGGGLADHGVVDKWFSHSGEDASSYLGWHFCCGNRKVDPSESPPLTEVGIK